MSLIVYTAAVGDTDAVQAPASIHAGARYLCFSDRPCPAPYEWVPVEATDDPRLQSRTFKVKADHPALQGASMTLWHDASYQLTDSLDWVAKSLEHAEIVGLAHHRRDHRMEDEAIAIAARGFVGVVRAWKLAKQYRSHGFIGDTVTLGGLLARRICPKVQRFNATWWREVQRWNGRDQACLDYAAWDAGIAIGHLAGWMRDNPFAIWRRAVA